MNTKLNERITKAIKLANDALARYHSKRDEARADGTLSDEVGAADMAEYAKQTAIASELSAIREELNNEALNKELFQ